MSKPDPQIILSAEEATRYRGWLSDALRQADQYLGTEAEDFLDPLLQMELMIESHQESKTTPELERGFASASGHDSPEQASIDAILAYAVTSFNRRFQAASDTQAGVLALLKQAGASVTYGGSDFIKTDPRALQAAGKGPSRRYEPVTQPRLSWLVEGLRTIGIYPEDLSIHVRDADPRKMKAAPHLLIEIPRLKKQVMLNEQKEQITFVAQERFELAMWENLTKYQLKKVPGVTPAVLRTKDRWLDRVLGLLQDGDAKAGAKIDVLKDAAKPYRKSMNYSVDLIVESIEATHEATGDYPSVRSGLIMHGPLANGSRNWKSVNDALSSIWRVTKDGNSFNGLTQANCPYVSLADLRTQLGLIEVITVEQIQESLQAAREAGVNPTKYLGVIEHGPLADGTRSWGDINTAMKNIWKKENPVKSSRGLTLENCPYTSLADIKAKLNLDGSYTVEQIWKSMEATYAEKGEYPISTSGVVEYGPLANGSRTWHSVNSAMRVIWREDTTVQSCNGLTRENCPYASLGELKLKHGVGRYSVSRQKPDDGSAITPMP